MKKIKGVVIEGKKLGRRLGFPTANVQTEAELEGGVYAGFVLLEGQKFKSAIFVWPDKKLLETYIFDFSRSIYGQEIEVEIGDKIREVVKFENQAQLVSQIKKDVALIAKN